MERSSVHYNLSLIVAELEAAKEKHPDYPGDMFRQVAIIHEELGEVTKAILHNIYEDGPSEDIKKELIQTAAMCVRITQTEKKHIKQLLEGGNLNGGTKLKSYSLTLLENNIYNVVIGSKYSAGYGDPVKWHYSQNKILINGK